MGSSAYTSQKSSIPSGTLFPRKSVKKTATNKESIIILNRMSSASKAMSTMLTSVDTPSLSRLDGFDRILEAFRSMKPTEEVNNWLKSVEGLYYKMQNDLREIGLTPIETVGKDVDLNCMEVVDYRSTADYPNNTVMHELKRGYRYKGKVLRDAQVVIAHNEENRGR